MRAVSRLVAALILSLGVAVPAQVGPGGATRETTVPAQVGPGGATRETTAARFVEFASVPGAVRLAADRVVAPIVVDASEDAGVRRAAADLQQDVERVTGARPALVTGRLPKAADVIVVGTLGRSAVIDRLARSRRIDVSGVRGRWEASVIQVVANPWRGVERALVVAGSDRRGTIFGVYDVSEQIGVSPWYWWADVPVRHHDQLFVRAGRYVRHEPAVKYRGIFLNDEAPALSGWAHEKFGGFNSRFYARVFELILRLRGNFLWPAMWGNAFNDDDPANPALANEYGVVIGTSHHEPMMRAHDEWRRYGSGAWNYTTNPDALRKFWTDGITRTAKFENIVTLGMRGDGDAPMSEQANVALLERIVADQRDIIAKQRNPNLSAVPQVWALYKEVQEYYEKGMRVPDDVTLLWSDDNWGNIRRLPTPEERNRAGGAGIYYHFDYVGGPRSYKWLNTVPIAKVWEQMRLAWQYGATRIWIVNVGDLKPMEFPIQFFLDYAWDPARLPADKLGDYTRAWAEREFGPAHAAAIADIVTKYTLYNGRRKPEMLEPRTYSLVDYGEAERVVSDYRELAQQAEQISTSLPAEARDAFYQLVLYPVKACAVINEMYVAAGRNRLYAVQGRASANDLADRVRALFLEDQQLSREYNETLAGGKWSHMMDQTHIGYTFWNQPIRNAMPGVQQVQLPPRGEMGIAIEGSEESWPDQATRPAVLPALSVYDTQPRSIDIFNRGRQPFAYSVETRDPWLLVDVPKATVEREQRIRVRARWSEVPVGTERSSLVIKGPNNASVEVIVPLLNPPTPRPGDLDGFVETNGVVSIEAEHFARAIDGEGTKWLVIPNHGRTLSGVTTEAAANPAPASAAAPAANPAKAGSHKTSGSNVGSDFSQISSGSSGAAYVGSDFSRISSGSSGAAYVGSDFSRISSSDMRLDYKMYLFSKGPVTVDAYLAPTQKFQPGAGFRYAVSFDDGPPQVVNMHADQSLAAWEREVADGAQLLSSQHTIAQPGYHVLTFRPLDPGIVLQKLVVRTSGARRSYLGPPESVRGRASAATGRE